jgi:hypothetical protein
VNKNKRNVIVLYALNHIKRLGKVKDALVLKARLAKLLNSSLMQVALLFHFAGWWNKEGVLLMAFLAQACTTTISSATAVLALFPKRQELSTNGISTVCADMVVVDAHDEFVIVLFD